MAIKNPTCPFFMEPQLLTSPRPSISSLLLITISADMGFAYSTPWLSWLAPSWAAWIQEVARSQWQDMGLTLQKHIFFLARVSAHGKKKQRKKSKGFHGNSWELWTTEAWGQLGTELEGLAPAWDRMGMRPGATGRQGGLRAIDPAQDTELAQSQDWGAKV